MENWKLLLAGIRNLFEKTVLKITGQVEVINIPEIQKVEIINPQEPTETVEVSNIINYSDKLDAIIGELSKEEQSADYSEIINALKEVVRTLEVDNTDYSPIISAINNAVKELKQKYPEFDDTKIISAIKEIPQIDFEKYLKYGELPVLINDKQFEKLSKSLGSTITSVSGGSKDTYKLVPFEYNQIDLTYVTAGNGIGEVETATFKYGVKTVAILTLSYDANDKLSSVIRT